jgi:hypothetical protein
MQNIQINIPNPCSQAFGKMPDKDGGLYCGKCETVVYDFSQMTDFELLSFFKTKPNVHCGRFHQSQLNRTIAPVKIKNSFLNIFSKIAASLFTILTIKTQQVKAQGEIVKANTQQNAKTNFNANVLKDSIVIKGNIKSEKNEALQNAIVKFDGVATTQTDAFGNYEFKLHGITENHNLYITCPNYVPVVRTYNPVMGSTVFDIVMGHRDSNAVEFYTDHTAGVMEYENINFPSIYYKNNSTFCKDEKEILHLIAKKLKENPNSGILIIAYSTTSIKVQIITEKRLKAIKKFLIEKEGISEDRLSTIAEVGETNSGLVEFKSQYY